MEMNGQTERCGQSRSKNSKFIKPTSLNALQLRETGPAINIRGGFVIVVDPWSGIWLKWMPDSFDETLQSAGMISSSTRSQETYARQMNIGRR